ncbi:uncharacterized protein LOC125544937 isoform X2 [Triticum urartu]|uniref:uncharacterized protein LOC119269115 isoform X2 n=1 Tax=Triticum dicoccoides TaxID=85692 RepID=UPI0008438D8F|nr:uncharacterized protein LOC119269115 isoform X2 [Triticum dicoccoides]XP_044341476.1 uncharacterized protein LOC123062168 isoform X2 [Triticum aestivum]XP_048551127.1 uncharacterized protein LOC125530770 isoform X2 [Triticum urartu]XP_048564687.1 uncharacterized protein LOC125544937 isoform X2 [Triticum urartu]
MKVSRGRSKMRNTQRKPSILNFDAGCGSSLSFIVIGLVGCTLIACLFFIGHQVKTGHAHSYPSHLPATRELEEVEEEHFRLPPPHKVNPRAVKRAVKRRGSTKVSKIIDDYLDGSSALHDIFFPSETTAVNPTKGRNDSMYFYPGRVWLDTDGNAIQAHGGGILYDHNTATYYWYGENKDGPTYQIHPEGAHRVDIIGVSCYSSKDLWSWTHEGIVLPGERTNITHDLHISKVLERPKVIYNDRTRQYVMWMHVDDGNYTKASVGVAVSRSPTGPFSYLYSFRPHGFDSRDMTIFKDDDGMAYLFYASRGNTVLHVSPLTNDYLNVTSAMRTILVRRFREAPAVFKLRGTYYMITSRCSGWAPNPALAHATHKIMGPWETLGNPCVGGNHFLRLTTFLSQSTFVLPLPGLPGTFIFMADRWNPSDLRDSRYVWLPLSIGGLADEALDYSFGFPSWSRVSIYWHRKWRLPEGWRKS